MTENEKLRALLAEARDFADDFRRIAAWERDRARAEVICDRIDAALAEPMSVHPSHLTDVVTLLENERDEALAEVERLKQEVRIAKHTVDMRTVKQQMKRNQEAFKRGAEAMREAAVQYLRTKGWFMNQQVACSVSALPLPEEKP